MKRRLFNLLAGLSLLLCVATAGLWVRSWLATDHVWLDSEHPQELYCDRGDVCFAQWALPPAFAVTLLHKKVTSVDRQGQPIIYTGHWRFDHRPLGTDKDRTGDHSFLGCKWSQYHNMTLLWEPNAPEKRFGIPGNDRFLSIPLWLVFLATAILPLGWAFRWHRMRTTLAMGCCQICGYDLRATPDRCPECGTVPGKAGAP
jgi:hypothetical protein